MVSMMSPIHTICEDASQTVFLVVICENLDSFRIVLLKVLVVQIMQ
jgi:hypothetical protein